MLKAAVVHLSNPPLFNVIVVPVTIPLTEAVDGENGQLLHTHDIATVVPFIVPDSVPFDDPGCLAPAIPR